jgi:hypothetical protein
MFTVEVGGAHLENVGPNRGVLQFLRETAKNGPLHEGIRFRQGKCNGLDLKSKEYVFV